MIKNIIGGIAVGIANVIPGVSGGTMMVLLGIFDRIMEAIPGVLKFKKNPNFKEDVVFLLQVLLGAAIGLVGFAKVLEYLFAVAPTPTMYWFIGLIAFSIPVFMKKEMHGAKVHWIAFAVGVAIVFALELLNPGESNYNPAIPSLSLTLLLTSLVMGVIGGFSMFMPGVSGSMVLLILGYYYIFKTYLANVLTFRIDVILPLGFMAVGILLGIILSAKVLSIALKKSEDGTHSFLLGLIVASTLVLVKQTLSATFTMPLIITSLLAFLLGGVIVILIDKVA